MRFSIIIPVFNRPDEVNELLDSLCGQSTASHEASDMEVIIVEDGSSVPCKSVVEKYCDSLNIRYFVKQNGGPGPARNFGVEHAIGDYVIILDSDVVLPPGYLAAIENALADGKTTGRDGLPGADAFGGPDSAHPDFSDLQKAINYAMTSFFTTGGIRGGKAKLDKFFPRSFNMGMRRSIYNDLGGFARMRFGEDIDFSYRVVEAGYTSRLFPEAWVWHKRRSNFHQFFKQVHNSGIARINLSKRHPGTLKAVHMLPAAFTLGTAACLLGSLLSLFGLPFMTLCLSPLVLFSLLIFADSSIRNKSLHVGVLSIAASFIQLIGYGSGFLRAWWQRCILHKGEFEAFTKNFYK